MNFSLLDIQKKKVYTNVYILLLVANDPKVSDNLKVIYHNNIELHISVCYFYILFESDNLAI